MKKTIGKLIDSGWTLLELANSRPISCASLIVIIEGIRNFIIDMAKAVTLKNKNNEEVYPVTDLSLVNGNIPTGRIADNAITTGKIANKAITSDKIDWTTMTCGIVSSPASDTIPANGRTRIAQITLPKGKYAMIASASYWASTAARRCLYISFESSTGGVVSSMKNGLYGTTAGGDTLEATNTALVNVTAKQATVSVYVNSGDFSGTFHQWGAPSVLYFRVG